MKALSAMALILASRFSIATEWPTDNVEFDKLLRAKSARYDEIAKTIEQRKGYRIVSDSDTKLGNVTYDE